MQRQRGSMRVVKVVAIALMLAGCGGGGAESGTGPGGRGAGVINVDVGAAGGQGGRTALHRGGTAQGGGGATVNPAGGSIPSHGGNGGGASQAAGQGATGGRAAVGGRSGNSQGDGGSGVPASGTNDGVGGQPGSGGRPVDGSGGQKSNGGGGGSGGPVVTGAGGRSVTNSGGAAGAVASAAGAGGASRGAAGGAPGPAACDAVTCPTGCCNGNVCVNMPSAQQCGLGGAACQTCAACQRCSASGACELDPESRWQMFAVSASLAPTYSDGSAWDGPRDLYGGSLPDPFAQFEMPADNPLGWTDTTTDTLSPMWNQAVVPASAAVRASDLLPGGRSWDLWIGDDDGDNYAELMCEITGPLTPADFATGGFGRTGVDGCLTVSMRLVCAM